MGMVETARREGVMEGCDWASKQIRKELGSDVVGYSGQPLGEIIRRGPPHAEEGKSVVGFDPASKEGDHSVKVVMKQNTDGSTEILHVERKSPLPIAEMLADADMAENCCKKDGYLTRGECEIICNHVRTLAAALEGQK